MALRIALSQLKKMQTSSFTNTLMLRNASYSVRNFSSTQPQRNLEDAKKKVALLTEDPGNDAKLKMYALYKQATVGKCNTKKPGVFDFVGQAKWTAWNELGDLSQSDAESEYVSFVDKLVGSADAAPPQAETDSSSSSSKVEGIDITKENGICTIKFNRPKKLNAITTVAFYTSKLAASGKEASKTLLSNKKLTFLPVKIS